MYFLEDETVDMITFSEEVLDEPVQCALITVSEILDLIYNSDNINVHDFNYWLDVRMELKKMSK